MSLIDSLSKIIFFQGAHWGEQFDKQLREPRQGAAVLQEHKASHSHEALLWSTYQVVVTNVNGLIDMCRNFDMLEQNSK